MKSQYSTFGLKKDLYIVTKVFLGRMLLSFLVIPIPLFTLEAISFVW